MSEGERKEDRETKREGRRYIHVHCMQHQNAMLSSGVHVDPPHNFYQFKEAEMSDRINYRKLTACVCVCVHVCVCVCSACVQCVCACKRGGGDMCTCIISQLNPLSQYPIKRTLKCS